MPLSALPANLQDVEHNFPDDEQYGTKTLFGRLYRWFNKATKTWFAFSFRCTQWWARWRMYPVILLAIGGKGPWRGESQGGQEIVSGENWTFGWKDVSPWYLSRVQYYKRWHLALQWPLLFSFHFYPKASDVPVFGKPRPDTDGKLWFFYWNHFDNELVYWMLTSVYLGRNWK